MIQPESSVTHLRPLFHIVAVISNPVLYKSRYRLYKQFEQRMLAEQGIHFHTVELAQGKRGFAVTERGNPYHTQVTTEDELWIKESLINHRARTLAGAGWPDWKYLAWIDADVSFNNPNWVNDTLHELQVAHVVQMFQNAVDLGPNYEALTIHPGFVWSYLNSQPASKQYQNWHPGYAWACTRYAFDRLGGLIDKAICGSGDRNMACALISKGDQSYHEGVHANYAKMVSRWQERAEKYIKKDVSFVKGSLNHYHHGPKSARGYRTRWGILVDHQYDPENDVYVDGQGILRLDDDRIGLREDLKKYLRSRNEDSIEV